MDAAEHARRACCALPLLPPSLFTLGERVGTSRAHWFSRLALLVGIGALTYAGGLMLFARETIGDLIAMARDNAAT